MKDLCNQIKTLVWSARRSASRGLNAIHVMTNFNIGRMIVLHEQKGQIRAQYGERILSHLSRELVKEFGRGFSLRNLENMRRFYVKWKDRTDWRNHHMIETGIVIGKEKAQTPSAEFRAEVSNPMLSWSHYVLLMRIEDIHERNFYEIESMKNDWSLRELKRQFDSSLFERIALSKEKDSVIEMSNRGQVLEKPKDIFKEPYVLEFLGLKEEKTYSERDLESAIIDKLEQFLLEMGKGFLFEARQKRFTFDSDHFYVDLVFYNRILRCYVLLDLKLGKLSHQDLGQMQMYVNYFDRYVRLKDENPTIGVILCRDKNEAVVELTLPKDTNIYPARYQLYLPSKEELKKKLIEWSDA